MFGRSFLALVLAAGVLAVATTSSAAAQFTQRVNAGGADFTDGSGDLFSADQAYTAGSWGYTSPTQANTYTDDVTGTTDDALYQAIRGWSTFSYLFDGVPVGDYEITLYWFEPGRPFVAGDRLIDVSAEGVLALDNVDIIAESGGAYAALSRTFTVAVLDGQLNLDFAIEPSSARAANVFISGIAVVGVGSTPDINASPLAVSYGPVLTGTTSDRTVTVSNTGSGDLDVTGLSTTNAVFSVVSPATPFTIAAGGAPVEVTVRFSPVVVGVENGNLEIVSNDPDEGLTVVSLTGEGVDELGGVEFRVNAAGAAYTDVNGDLFSADQAYTAGGFGYSGQTQANTRSGDVLGTTDDPLYLSIRGWNTFSYLFDNLPADDYTVTFYWYEPGLSFTAGQRLIDVTMEGSLLLDNVDVVAEAGGPMTALTRSATVAVSDGQLNIDISIDPASTRANNVFVSAIAVVQGGGGGPVADISVSPPSVAYGSVQTGTTFDRVVTISNTGAADLDVTSLTTTNAAFTVVSPATPFTITSGGAPVDVMVQFGPGVAQAEAGDLQIASNDPDESVVSVPLTGEGVDTPVGVAFRINAGGFDLADANGHLFFADQAYSAGSYGYVGGTAATYGGSISGTTDDVLYQDVRQGASFSYQFDGLPVGDYEVRLYMMEPTYVAADLREFDVSVEGVQIFTAMDIAWFAGAPSPGAGGGVGTLRAYSEQLVTTVLDGQLNIDFVATTDNAILSAIAIREMPAASPAAYTEVTGDVGIAFTNVVAPGELPPASMNSGSAWADYDNDGDLDLYITNHGGANVLYRNDGDLTSDGLPDFTDVAVSAGVDLPSVISLSAVFIDYDNDGDQDLFVTNHNTGNSLFENQLIPGGTPVFVDVSAGSGLTDTGRGMISAWGDYDQDGLLDVYIVKHFVQMGAGPSEDQLFHNDGGGVFSAVTGLLCPGGTAPCTQTAGLGFSAVWTDYDDDGDLDLYLANDNINSIWTDNVLWRNDGPDGGGGWIFTDVSVASGAGTSANAMGLSVGDIDNDGNIDLAFSNISPNNLLRNRGDGTFDDVSAITGIQRSYVKQNDENQWTWGTVFFDHDNNGWIDVLFAAGRMTDAQQLQPVAFMANNGDGTFTDRTVDAGIDAPGRYRNVSTADFDGDGFVDVLLTNPPDWDTMVYPSGGVVRLYHNDALALGSTNHWLTILVQGTESNRDGIGAKITVETPDGMSQVREINSGPSHGGGDHRAGYFGLGDNTTATITIRWPNGVTEVLGVFAADQQLLFVEPAAP